jgi:SAM-dependent methyltransferase
MRKIEVRLPLYVPDWLGEMVRRMKEKALTSVGAGIDLFGDREIEWSFVISRLPNGPGEVLDFGASFGNLSIAAAQRGFHVLALDLDPERFPWKHPSVEFLQADLLKVDLPAEHFDFILNCSSVEHVGLQGRYGVAADETDGDLEAMSRYRKLLKPNGRMLLTIPCGRDAAIAPWHRVYGERRLPKLLHGFETVEEEYWAKKNDNRWNRCDRATALSFVPTGHPTDATKCSYALGCFVLKPKSQP